MKKLALGEVSSFFGYSEERNTSLRLKWPRTGPHTVLYRCKTARNAEHCGMADKFFLNSLNIFYSNEACVD